MGVQEQVTYLMRDRESLPYPRMKGVDANEGTAHLCESHPGNFAVERFVPNTTSCALC